MASDEFSAGGPSQRPTVQVGDPFMEKLLARGVPGDLRGGPPGRHPGHGRRGAHLVVGGDGGPQRQRARPRSRPRASPRQKARPLRDAPQRVAGADAPRRPARQGGAGDGDLQEVGARRGHHRARHRHRPLGDPRHARLRPARRRAHRARARGGLRPAGRLSHRRRPQVRSPAEGRRLASRAPRLRSGGDPRPRVLERGAPRDGRLAEPGLAPLGLPAVRSHRPRRHPRASGQRRRGGAGSVRARRRRRSTSCSPSPATATAGSASSTRARAARWRWPRRAATSSARGPSPSA